MLQARLVNESRIECRTDAAAACLWVNKNGGLHGTVVCSLDAVLAVSGKPHDCGRRLWKRLGNCIEPGLRRLQVDCHKYALGSVAIRKLPLLRIARIERLNAALGTLFEMSEINQCEKRVEIGLIGLANGDAAG